MFVGGTVTALYPLEGDVDVRPTLDVDCVVDVGSTAHYYAFIDRLLARGFRTCTDDGAPLCRLVYQEILVDVVPATSTAIGPTNRWYQEAILHAESHAIAAGVDIQAITPLYFVATKLEAFRGRGRGDYQASHDLEDLLGVIAGLSDLRTRIADATSDVATAVRDELVELRARDAFIDAVPAHFDGDVSGQERADELLEWLRSLRRKSASPLRGP